MNTVWLALLFLLFVLLPFVELALLLLLADSTSWQWTLGLVIVTGVLGGLLAKSQGFRALERIRDDFAAGRIPAESLSDAAMILCAGCLLLTPGMLTDLFGLSLLLPPVRRFYLRRAGAWLRRRLNRNGHFTSGGPPRPPGAGNAAAGSPRGNSSKPFGIEDAVEVPPAPPHEE